MSEAGNRVPLFMCVFVYCFVFPSPGMFLCFNMLLRAPWQMDCSVVVGSADHRLFRKMLRKQDQNMLLLFFFIACFGAVVDQSYCPLLKASRTPPRRWEGGELSPLCGAVGIALKATVTSSRDRFA